MSDKTGRLIAFALFSVAASIVLAAMVYSQATLRYVDHGPYIVDARTGEAFGNYGEVTGKGTWIRAMPPLGEGE